MKRNLISCMIIAALSMVSCGGDDSDKSCSQPPVVSAGNDLILSGVVQTELEGTTNGEPGTWSIAEGTGGEIVPGDPAVLKGKLGYEYRLEWESTNDCGTSTDDVVVEFNKTCGSDRTINNFVDNMHWIQQACFRIETSSFTIYTDPNSITKKDTADLILISHPHGDHWTTADLDMISGPNTIIIAPVEVTYSGPHRKRIYLTPGQEYNAFGCISVKAVPAYNIVKTNYHPKEKNWVGYVVTVDGVTFYHAGDTELVPEMKDITCDIALLPLGQTYTFDHVSDAVQAAKDVKAKVAIPMHFGLYEGTSDDALSFKDLLDGVIPVVIKEKGL